MITRTTINQEETREYLFLAHLSLTKLQLLFSLLQPLRDNKARILSHV